MRNHLLRVAIAVACLCGTAWGQASQSPPAGARPFAGRWEILIKSGTDTTAMSFFIVDIADGPALTAKIVDSMGAPAMTAKVKEVSVKGDELLLVIDATIMRQFTLRFTGKRVGDHLEGTATPEEQPDPQTWIGQRTTKDKVTPLAATPATPETKAYTDAVMKPAAERLGALQQFLKDYPETKRKEQIVLQIAQSYPTPAEKIAALRKFIEDYPNSTSKDTANLQIALAPTAPADKAAALHKFMDEFPSSRLKDEAAYELVNTNTAAPARLAAQEEFVKAYPKSTRARTVYQSLIDSYMRAKPVDEAKLGAAIDGFINATPDIAMPMGPNTMNMRAGAMNTLADRLMVDEVMLDKALDVIQKAVAAAGDKEVPQSRAVYVTTLGQVLFKLKRYDEAERELKRAISITGEGDGEAYLFLGKLYEVRNDDAAALDAYFKSVEVGATADAKISLRRAWTKKNGSAAGLEEKLDEMYRARPKPFEPGTFTRKPGQAANPSSPATQRVVLAELFTGAECVPCVGADLAFDGLNERYDHDTVALLIYHLHIPGPDPMTNADTEARSNYYEVRGTPTAIVDGTASPAGGGSAAQSEKLFAGLKTQIEQRLDKPPLATLSGFKAIVHGTTMTVSGQAGLTKTGVDAATRARLHVALVQDSVRYTGANGVRFHSYVVRGLVGSPEGAALNAPGAEGKNTKFSEKIDVSSVSHKLDEYLTKYETGHSRPNVPFTFSDRVDQLDPKALLVVAFVQDEKTKEILQATVVTPKR